MKDSEQLIPIYFQLFTEISIIEHLSRNRLEKVLPEGMSMSQFGVLNHLSRLGGEWGPAQLAAAFQVTKGTMTNTLQKLEAQGYVAISGDPSDARAKLVSLTMSGRKAHEKAVRAAGGVMTDLFETVPVAGVKSALPFLSHLRKTLDETR